MTKKITDVYGTVEISKDVLWGVNTQRSLNNFAIGTEKMPLELIKSLILIKKAIAQANGKTGHVAIEKTELIVRSCDAILREDFMKHFPLSIWQTGSGTQTNMNVNEVIANYASSLDTSIKIHPNDDVNYGQSTNDVFPSGIHLMSIILVKEKLLPSLTSIIEELREKVTAYQDIIKVGRTHLQDAVYLSLGQEFSAYLEAFIFAKKLIEEAILEVNKIPIGGTAVGTGLNAYKGFDKLVCDNLSLELNHQILAQENKFQGLSYKDALLNLHQALNLLATSSLKFVDDIRLLASGPRCGLGELELPANEAGSSIMPGKVNPTQAEAMSMICLKVMGNNQTISFSNSQGRFELNAYMPLIAFDMWQSINLLAEGLDSFNHKCLKGIVVNKEKIAENLERSLMSATRLNTILGYDEATKIVKEAHRENKTIKEVVQEKNIFTEAEINEIFDYAKLV